MQAFKTDRRLIASGRVVSSLVSGAGIGILVFATIQASTAIIGKGNAWLMVRPESGRTLLAISLGLGVAVGALAAWLRVVCHRRIMYGVLPTVILATVITTAVPVLRVAMGRSLLSFVGNREGMSKLSKLAADFERDIYRAAYCDFVVFAIATILLSRPAKADQDAAIVAAHQCG